MLGEVIGRGGQGTVYSARQLGVDRWVAVKLVPVSDENTTEIARFEREARVAGTLDHPNCLPVYAAGEEHGLLYLVMRLVDGPTLAQIVETEGPLSSERASRITTQVAGALDYAHRAGLVHRDLKPANILIEQRGGVEHAWVSDFGLMRGLDEFDQITLTGQWVGTAQFAAPEQRRGQDVGAGADIYALGGVLAYMLGPEPPGAAAPVLKRALADNPADRFPHAGELAAAAERAIGAKQTRGRRTRRPLGIGVLAASVCVIAAALLVLSDRGGSGGGNPAADHGGRLVTRNFTAQLPRRWVVTQRETAMQGYSRTVVQSPGAQTIVYIDRTANAPQTLAAHASTVEQAAAKTPGYHLQSHISESEGDLKTIVWSFTLSGIPHGSRVDVFRRIGTTNYAVLGTSNSLAQSRAAAQHIAGTLKAR